MQVRLKPYTFKTQSFLQVLILLSFLCIRQSMAFFVSRSVQLGTSWRAMSEDFEGMDEVDSDDDSGDEIDYSVPTSIALKNLTIQLQNRQNLPGKAGLKVVKTNLLEVARVSKELNLEHGELIGNIPEAMVPPSAIIGDERQQVIDSGPDFLTGLETHLLSEIGVFDSVAELEKFTTKGSSEDSAPAWAVAGGNMAEAQTRLKKALDELSRSTDVPSGVKGEHQCPCCSRPASAQELQDFEGKCSLCRQDDLVTIQPVDRRIDFAGLRPHSVAFSPAIHSTHSTPEDMSIARLPPDHGLSFNSTGRDSHLYEMRDYFDNLGESLYDFKERVNEVLEMMEHMREMIERIHSIDSEIHVLKTYTLYDLDEKMERFEKLFQKVQNYTDQESVRDALPF